jgi:hypothetical protein
VWGEELTECALAAASLPTTWLQAALPMTGLWPALKKNQYEGKGLTFHFLKNDPLRTNHQAVFISLRK